jgi:hypothetical protein
MDGAFFRENVILKFSGNWISRFRVWNSHIR